MKIDAQHWLSPAIKAPIPGGAVMAIRRFLVIHFTVGASAASSIGWWRKLGNGVCAHFVIERDGTIYQTRPCNRTAGHAGSSKWKDPKTGITYHGEYGDYTYSAKSGFSTDLHNIARSKLEITREK